MVDNLRNGHAVRRRHFELQGDNSETTVDSLKGLHGKDFDNAYIKSVGVDRHQNAVKAFQREVENGQNADLKKAAGKALPTIQEHLKTAQALAAKKGVQ